MACEILVGIGAVLTVWGRPHRSDMGRVLTTVREEACSYGRPVVYVTRVPLNAPTPDAKARQDLNELLPHMMEACHSYHVILEGHGFMAAMKRGALTSILQPFWKKRVFYVHAAAQEVLDHVDGDERANTSELLRLATRRGLLRCASPLTLPPPRPGVLAS